MVISVDKRQVHVHTTDRAGDSAAAVQPLTSLTPAVSGRSLSLDIKRAADAIGFDLVGIADIRASGQREYIADWFAQGRHGTMEYLSRMMPAKMDIRTHLPWAVSAVSVAISYHHPAGAASSDSAIGAWRELNSLDESMATSSQHRPAAGIEGSTSQSAVMGKIASYAAGRDYHRTFTAMLQKLERAVRELVPADFTARAYVDTGPCLERELAARAGIGWIGKNTMLIHPRHGSWFLLGELFLSVPLPADAPVPDRCGTCTRCIDACPTVALTPYRMDASKCISYLTLEHRTDIAPEFHAPMRDAGYIAGCDICQTVCPFNRRPLAASHPDFQPRAFSGSVSPHTVLHWTEHDWDQATRGRAFRRAKYPMWQRNAAILI
jgi:epoxyqueuosine reductase